MLKNKEFSLDEIRLHLEKYFQEHGYEEYLIESGQKEVSNIERITEKYDWLFSVEIREKVEAECDVSDEQDHSRLLLLMNYLLQSAIGHQCNTLYDRLINKELHLRVKPKHGEAMTYRQACAQQRFEKDREKREYIFHKRLIALTELNDLYRELWLKTYKTVSQLSQKNYITFYESIFQTNLKKLTTVFDDFLIQTDDLYTQYLDKYLHEKVGISFENAALHDISHLFSGSFFDKCFDEKLLVSIAAETMDGLGLDLTAGGNITIDVTRRKNKSRRGFVSLIKTPDQIMLCQGLTKGEIAFTNFFHELGHAQHCAHISPSLDFEYRYLNLESSSEGFAFFFEDIIRNRNWLNNYVNFANKEQFESYREFSLFLVLFNTRSTIANLKYELLFHADVDFQKKPELCHDIFTNALKIPYPRELYFEIIDPGFYSVCYLLGGILESNLLQFCTENFGQNWFSEPKVGTLLKELWSKGGQLNVQHVLSKTSHNNELDITPLVQKYR